MHVKRIVFAAAAAFSLSVAAAPFPAATAADGDSTLVLARSAHGGVSGGSVGRGSFSAGRSNFSAGRGNYSISRGNRFARFRGGDRDFGRHRRFGRGFYFDGGYDDYDGGSCYWNCRQYHGPGYCRVYAANYC